MFCHKKNCQSLSLPTSKFCFNHSAKRCMYPYCTKSAQRPTKYCVQHGGGKRCVHSECVKGAQRKTNYCVQHGGGKRCIKQDCTKSASGSSNYCKAHGGGKRCIYPECVTGAQGKTNYCVSHGGGKRCAFTECISNSVSPSDFCIFHGGGRRCIEYECKVSAVGSSDYCKAHGGGKRCTHPECIKSAIGKSGYCAAHGGGKRCPNCIDWIDSRCGKKKYDGYCATCFKRVFPTDPRSTVLYEHTKEIRVRNAILQRSLTDPLFSNFVHDKPIYTSECNCTHRRRVDHRKIIGNTILAIETDEYGHTGYDEKDEEIRYDDLYMIHSGKWIFIRFNPDPTQTDKTDLEDRMEILLDEMKRHITRIQQEENVELVEIYKLFYT